MKKIMALIAVFGFAFALVGCQTQTATPTETEVTYEDGRYRGSFIDRNEVQVVVQFNLVDNIVTSASFRELSYGGVRYRTSTEPAEVAVRVQHEEALAHLIGKDIRVALVDLYTPAELELTDYEAFTGATIRSNKIISAIRDGLNRGIYSY